MNLFWYQKRSDKLVQFIFRLKPTQLVLLSFIILIASGTFLLALPWATLDGKGLNLIDALFTSTSAACVTGLTVVDVQKELPFLAQWSWLW